MSDGCCVSRYAASDEGIVAVVSNKLNGYCIDEEEEEEEEEEGQRGEKSIGCPRAALMSASNILVDS